MSVTMDLGWWLSIVLLPAIGGLFWLNLKTRSAAFAGIQLNAQALADYKLYVAENYVSRQALQDMEKHLVERLRGIEDQLKTINRRGAT